MRVLTKSRYKLGLECPNKLFFTKKVEFANHKSDDSFLKALASGGFQVEELARLHYPNGILVEEKDVYDYQALASTTQELLNRENVVIFEAAFLVDGLFIRTDILVKKGAKIELIEVKAKSYHPENQNEFVGKKGAIKPLMKPYLFDVAFQKYVIQKCHPNYQITSYLMLADKSKTTCIEGLNQKFRITKKTNERTGVIKKINQLQNPETESILSKINVSDLISRIETGQDKLLPEFSFEQSILNLRDTYLKDNYYNYPIQCSACKKCEFKTTKEEKEKGLKSGFEYCWSKQVNWTEKEFEKPNLFEVWDYRSLNKTANPNDILLDFITEDTIGFVNPSAGKLSRTERQWLQIEKAKNKDASIEVLKEELKEEMDTWVYPLNFIDFETSIVALPFYAGQTPYAQVAFQFSHHIYHKDGTIEHANQYLNSEPGKFPNFEFSRALMEALSSNNGSVFKFATHENSIVNAIIQQLEVSNELDKLNLMDFLKSISHSKENTAGPSWVGKRDMIDLCRVIKDYYYNPYTKGSNSIKKVLPAVFEVSKVVKSKYSQPIGSIGINSKNFKPNKIWLLANADGSIIDPYKNLPKPFDEFEEDFELISELNELTDGGAALTAYGKLQYTDLEQEERDGISIALLRYCELDTLAMVMIYEHLRELTN